ncbi:hypothetical protein J113_20870 [Mycobacterium tuberculosis CAS/NITR204]|uniref:Uncharacterized protein n=1 Tax=Mycobacterium tuberculosis CAS/NITR204 TaxID=1310114 RepID=R4MC68_MYCTX|nr:hypothetical protein J113_20870 [Mycobacterium tuberculosis CAS/NITR204]
MTTSTPRAVAASTSTLSSPTPARATILSLGAAAASASTVLGVQQRVRFGHRGQQLVSVRTVNPAHLDLISQGGNRFDGASLSAINTTGRLTPIAYRL